MRKILVLAISICCLFFATSAQETGGPSLLKGSQFPGKATVVGKDVRIKKNEPTVYITFERAGLRKPLYVGESNQGIWLRLHNNSRWAIFFSSSGVAEGDGDVALFYEVEALGDEGGQAPKAYSSAHMSSPFMLPRGKSAVFTVPREHLTKDLAIRIRFYYEWEGDDGFVRGVEPQHHVYFYSSDLPKQLQ